MTNITVYKDRDRQYKGFVCRGHAGYAARSFLGKPQPDILCASISVLVINTINALEELAGEQMTVSQDEKTGFIQCDFAGRLQEKSVFLLDAMVYGLENISRTYGSKYLQVNFEEVQTHD